MEIIKYPKRQDCHYKLTAGSSNETSINLSSDIMKQICPEGIDRGASKMITFKIFRDDYIKALCYIVGKLPLYGRGRGNNIVRYSYDFFQNELKKITDFFTESYADYTVSILHKEDGRVYLRDLSCNGFNIRNFIVEDCTTMYFINSVDLQIRLKLGETVVAEKSEDIDESAIDKRDMLQKEDFIEVITTPAVNKKLAVRDDILKDFIYKIVYLLSTRDGLFALEQFAEEKKSGNIQLKNSDKYKLTGMFIATTLNDILARNKFGGKVRWFEKEFTFLGKSVYLTTQWFGNGDYALMYDDFISLINDAYPNKFIFTQNNEGMYELWEIL
ncbi:hypothetical protein [Bacteroides sp.]|uniref:hypothetical protein n=1 Tax=Bacteroides sp. TaxID=29523 RepID=UPI002FCA0D17